MTGQSTIYATELAEPEGLEGRMRMVTEMMALTLQGALLTRHGDSALPMPSAPAALPQRYRGAFGTLPKGLDLDAIISRALPG